MPEPSSIEQPVNSQKEPIIFPDFPEGIKGPEFQFRRDLILFFDDLKATQVTDGFRIIGTNNGQGVYFFDDQVERLSPGTQIVSINDDGYRIIQSGNKRNVEHAGRKISLAHSPYFDFAIPASLNSQGIICGAVVKNGISYARMWSERGEPRLEDIAPNSCITNLRPGSVHTCIGFIGEDAAMWIGNEKVLLHGPNGERAEVTHINDAGIAGGYYTDSFGVKRACLWGTKGEYFDIGLEALQNHSYVCGVLEDGTIMVESLSESGKEYFIGRPGQMRAFTAKAIHSIEDYRLVSIDAVSPTGVLVAQVENIDLNKVVPVLIDPEIGRGEMKRKEKPKLVEN